MQPEGLVLKGTRESQQHCLLSGDKLRKAAVPLVLIRGVVTLRSPSMAVFGPLTTVMPLMAMTMAMVTVRATAMVRARATAMTRATAMVAVTATAMVTVTATVTALATPVTTMARLNLAKA